MASHPHDPSRFDVYN
jgi:hypothetical protein